MESVVNTIDKPPGAWIRGVSKIGHPFMSF